MLNAKSDVMDALNQLGLLGLHSRHGEESLPEGTLCLSGSLGQGRLQLGAGFGVTGKRSPLASRCGQQATEGLCASQSRDTS